MKEQHDQFPNLEDRDTWSSFFPLTNYFAAQHGIGARTTCDVSTT